MNLDEERQRYRALNDWFISEQGQYVAEALTLQLKNIAPLFARGIALQLGLCGKSPWLKDISSEHTWFSTPCLEVPGATFIASSHRLPLHRSSIDTVIAPLVQELFTQDKAPFDEIDRVLSAMGHIVFLGINPMSLWGLLLCAHRLPFLGPAGMRPVSPLTLKNAFLNRGYQQVYFESFYEVPPFRHERWIKRSLFLNEAGKLISLLPSGFYCLVMQKYQACPPEIKQRDRDEPLLLAG